MEDSLRSDGIVKKKSSSGCLVVKKKDQGGSGEGTGSSSSDELLETMRRKTREEIGSRRRAGDDGDFGGRGEFECEKKSGMDLFEFDEYDEFEGYNVGNEYGDGDNKSKRGRKRSGSSQEFRGSGSRKNLMVPEEPIRLEGKNGLLKVMVNSNKKKKKNDLFRGDCEKEHDEKQKSCRSEVVVKKNQYLRSSCNSESKQLEKRKSVVKSEKEGSKTRKPLMGKSGADDDLDSDEIDTSPKLDPPSPLTPISLKVIKDRLSESTTPVRSKIETIIPSQSSTPAKGKEGNVMGGGSTEKQQLRETIREMIIEAGWNIDYRPRRNRDYQDAVYIHPSGTAYWSITKAYEALQRQFNDQQGRSKSAGISSSFVPISEDLISKLTRQTQKKIEEKRKKRREDGMPRTSKQTAKEESVELMDSDQPEETLSSFIRQKRKSLKNKTHDLCQESGSESMDYPCKRTTRGDRVEKSLGATKNRTVQGSLGNVIERCTLRIRDLTKAQNLGSDGYVAYYGKRTILSWLVDSGIVQSGQKVRYMNHRRTRVRLEGWITEEGIHCGCCSKIVTVSKFELHAGSKLGRPFQNIVLESGVSLLQCQIDAWNQQDGSERQDFYSVDVGADDSDDDTCGTCGDGGDLICCDSCPSTFHQSCLEIKKVPLGDWHCPNCVCKFCSTASRNDGECDLSGDKLTTCSLCQRKYHKLCSTDNGTTPVGSSSSTAQFCGHRCEELYDHVWKIIGVKHELESGFSWSLIRRTNIDSDVANSRFAQRVECNSKLAVAHSVMDECFFPIIDRRSGINLIHNVLYNCGANFPRLNYGSFYTAILERGDDLISVASIRIHGTHLAEMPFIGTRHIYRRQGMCSRLLSAIESALSSFKVKKLIIPAISEHMSTWTTSFGFNPLEEDLKKELKSVNMLVFPGTDMLQKKQLMKPMTNDAKVIDFPVDHCQPPALTRKSSYRTSGDDEDERKDAKVHLNKNLDKLEVDYDPLDSAAPSNITDPFAPLAPDSTSNSGIQFPVVETASDQHNQVMEPASGSILSSSLSAPSITPISMEKFADPLNKDDVQSFMETATGGQPAGTVESSREELYAVPKDSEVTDALISVETDVKDCVHSDDAFGADVNIQSTCCEVKTEDHDIADLSFDNVPTDVNGMPSLLEGGNENQHLSFCADLNKPGVNVKDDEALISVAEVATDAEVACVKSLTSTSAVCRVGNHGDSNAASFEHANASANSNASEEINEQSNFSGSASGGPINSESSVKQSEMKSEPCETSTLSCEEVNVKDDVALVSVAEVATDAEIACVKSLTSNSVMCRVGNHGDSNAGAASFEHANASANSNASEEIKEQSNFSCSASGGPINSESSVKQSEMKSEPREASTLSCEVNAPTISNITSNADQGRKKSLVQVQDLPESSNVCLPHGAVEVHKNQDTISLSSFHGSTQNTISFSGIPTGCHDLMTSRVVSGDVTDPSELTVHSNGKGKVISDEIVPIEAITREYGQSKLIEPSEVVEDVDCECAISYYVSVLYVLDFVAYSLSVF